MAASMVKSGKHVFRTFSRCKFMLTRTSSFSKDTGQNEFTPGTNDGTNRLESKTDSEKTSALFRFTESLLQKDEHHEDTTDSDLVANDNFSTIMRNCKFTQIGEASSRVVLGKIIETVGDDLYIDIGGKFHCVCPRPQLKPEMYTRGVRVKVSLKDFELTAAFLGSVKHLTLLEADGSLIGLHRSSMTKPSN